MKRFTIATLFLVGLALVAGSALAEKDHPKGKKSDHPAKISDHSSKAADHPAKKSDHPGKGKDHAARMAKKLDLTEEQAAKVEGIFKAHHEAKKALQEKKLADLATVLNEEQMAKLKEFKAQKKMRKGWGKGKCGVAGKFRGLDLNEAQKKQIADICAEAKTKAKAVLTDEQRQKLQDRCKKVKKLSSCNLGAAKASTCSLGQGKATCTLNKDKPAI